MGRFDTHGGYFAPKDYFRVNTGGSHDENPNGGVQIGMDEQGIPNLLEEGEPVYKDYVFSDNIRIDPALCKQFNIPAKHAGKLYSEVADEFVDEAAERPNDPISQNGLEAMLGRLAQMQDAQKQQKEEAEIDEQVASLSPEDAAMLEEDILGQQEQTQQNDIDAALNSMSPEDLEALQQEMMAQQAMPQEGMPQEMAAPQMMAEGGLIRRFDDGTPGEVVEDEYYGGTIRPAVKTATYNPLIKQIHDAQMGFLRNAKGIADESPLQIFGPGNAYAAVSAAGDIANNLKNKHTNGMSMTQAAVIPALGATIGKKAKAIKGMIKPMVKQIPRIAAEMGLWEVGDRLYNSISNKIKERRAAKEYYNKTGSDSYGGNGYNFAYGGQIHNNLITNTISLVNNPYYMYDEPYEGEVNSYSLGGALTRLGKKAIKSAKLAKAAKGTTKVVSKGKRVPKPVRGANASANATRVKNTVRPSTKPISKPSTPTSSTRVNKTNNISGGRIETQANNANKLLDKALREGAKTIKNRRPLTEREAWGRYFKHIATTAGSGAATAAIIDLLSSDEPYYIGEDENGTPVITDTTGRVIPVDSLSTLGTDRDSTMQIPADSLAVRDTTGRVIPVDSLSTLGTDRDSTMQIPADSLAVRDTTGRVIPVDSLSTPVIVPVPNQQVNTSTQGSASKSHKPAKKAKRTKPVTYPSPALPDINIDFDDINATADKDTSLILAQVLFGDKLQKLENITPSSGNLVVSDYEAPELAGSVPSDTNKRQRRIQRRAQRRAKKADGNHQTTTRYAGLLSDAAMGLATALQDPDRISIPRTRAALPTTYLNLQNPEYQQVDANLPMNALLASNAATVRGLRNSGVSPSLGANLAALDYRAGQNAGTLASSIYDANYQNRNQVRGIRNANAAQQAQHNYNLGMQRANILNTARLQNAEASLREQLLNNELENAKYATLGSYYDSAKQSLAGIGKENMYLNQLNNDRSFSYDTDLNGYNYYNPSGGSVRYLAQEIADLLNQQNKQRG